MSSQTPLVACWLDQSIGVAGAHLDLKRRFEGISNRIVRWNYFDCGDQFNEFIDANPNVKLVAIMSGSFAKRLVSPVSDRDALHSVYVLCGNKAKYQSLTSDEPKVKGVFDSEDELFRKMRSDLQREFP
jgi:hypothetical protein